MNVCVCVFLVFLVFPCPFSIIPQQFSKASPPRHLMMSSTRMIISAAYGGDPKSKNVMVIHSLDHGGSPGTPF